MINLNIGFTTKSGIPPIKPDTPRTKYLPLPKTLEPASTTTKYKPEGVKITLSLGAQALQTVSSLQDDNRSNANTSHIGRGSLKELKSMLEYQLEKDGEDAKLLTEVPDSQDPARLELARQAIDFALTEKNNPFAGLSRQQLSHIAYEDTGAFTSAERYAAFEEMDNRDSDYYRSVMDQEKYETTIGNLKDSLLFLIRAKYQVSQSMCEAERAANGEVSADAYKNMLDAASVQGATLPKESVEYANLLSGKDQMVVSSVDDHGTPRWHNLSIHELVPKSKGEKNLDIAALLKNLRTTTSPSSPNANSAWITLYQRNDSYR